MSTRFDIVIDTLDAGDTPDTPFTLNVYRDNDDYGHIIGSGGGALVGYRIGDMLRELADAWDARRVTHENDGAMAPRTGAELRQMERMQCE